MWQSLVPKMVPKFELCSPLILISLSNGTWDKKAINYKHGDSRGEIHDSQDLTNLFLSFFMDQPKITSTHWMKKVPTNWNIQMVEEDQTSKPWTTWSSKNCVLFVDTKTTCLWLSYFPMKVSRAIIIEKCYVWIKESNLRVTQKKWK